MTTQQPATAARADHGPARGLLALRATRDRYLLWIRGHSLLADALLAAVIVALSVPPVSAFQGGSRPLSLALTLAVAAPLVWRRRAPLLVFLIITGVALVQWYANQALTDDLALLVAFYTIAAYQQRRHVLAAVVLLEAGAVLVAWPGHHPLWLLAILSSLIAAAGFLGFYVRTRRAYLASLVDRAERLERERDQQAQLAAASERARIARELHDIVAHNIAVMIALADGAAVTAASDLAQAVTLMGEVSATGRSALTEMRRLLGVLREPAEPGHSPQPTLADLDSLLAAVRAVGLPARLNVSGQPFPLPPTAQLALYRMIQEALTNTLKHAPGATAEVSLTYRPGEIGLEVTDNGQQGGQLDGQPEDEPDGARLLATGAGGHGLAGMRERAAVFGGQVSAGPRPDGGWRVHTVLRAGTERRVTTSILLADDQPMLRLGFRLVLDAQDDLRVVGEAGDGADAVRLAATLRPDVVLMDVRMPGMDGIEATRRITASQSTTRVLILTTFDLDEYAYAGLRAGASGFLLKDVPPPDLLSAIRAVASGDAVVAPSVTRRLLDAFLPHLPDPGSAAGIAARPEPPELAGLTSREREILAEVAAGRSNAEIAARLVLAEATVKTHVGRMLNKLHLRDRVQAVVYAYEHGLAGPGPGPRLCG